jgi:hypothetical protein
MSPGDDDISAALPRPPLPAPARRAEAIDAALRRFDGKAPAPARPAAAPWRRPYLGALVAATLVAVIAVPLAWESIFDRNPPSTIAVPREATPSAAAADAVASREAAAPTPSSAAGPAQVTSRDGPASVSPAPAPEASAPRSAEAPAAPAPVAEPAPTQMARQAEAPPPSVSADRQIVVTGSRIARPNLVSAVPVTVIGEANLVRGSSAKSSQRGDWNACTLDDPAPRRLDCGSKGAPLAEGLDRAQQGDLDGALAAFDRAVARASSSSVAYLNRGMAYQRKGDLDRARADLDRAVRLAPNSARAFYRRSLLRRQQGDDAGADADARRALAIDPDYSAVLGE